MFFTKGGLCSLPRGWGAPIYNWKSYLQFEKIKIEKSYLQFEKIKSKSYVQLEKIKTKTLKKKAMYNSKSKN